MEYQSRYQEETLTRAQLDTLAGDLLVEFGTNWCGHCLAAQEAIRTVVEAAGSGRHIKIEDGPGRPLGRSFRVKLWPTLVLLRNGEEVGRVVRPDRAALEGLLR